MFDLFNLYSQSLSFIMILFSPAQASKFFTLSSLLSYCFTAISCKWNYFAFICALWFASWDVAWSSSNAPATSSKVSSKTCALDKVPVGAPSYSYSCESCLLEIVVLNSYKPYPFLCQHNIWLWLWLWFFAMRMFRSWLLSSSFLLFFWFCSFFYDTNCVWYCLVNNHYFIITSLFPFWVSSFSLPDGMLLYDCVIVCLWEDRQIGKKK